MKLTICDAAQLLRTFSYREDAAKRGVHKGVKAAYRRAANVYLGLPAFGKANR